MAGCVLCSVYYRRQKWQYFLIDFCYFGNTALIFYLWFVFYVECFTDLTMLIIYKLSLRMF